MPHVTEHVPKGSSRSVSPYVHESSRKTLQQNRHTHKRIVQNHLSRRFDGCTSQIRSYLKLDFSHDANTSMGPGSKQFFQENLRYSRFPRNLRTQGACRNRSNQKYASLVCVELRVERFNPEREIPIIGSGRRDWFDGILGELVAQLLVAWFVVCWSLN